MAFLSFVMMLSVMIVIHEFGHFFAAKILKIRIEKFSLGFGPKLFSIKRGDTEYTVCLFLLGGFVKPAGESLQEFKGESYELLSRPVWQRILVVGCGPLLNYLLAFVCFWIVFIANPPLLPKVGRVLDGYPAKAAGIIQGDFITKIDNVSVQSWNQLSQMINVSAQDKDAIDLKVKRQGKIISLNVRVVEEVEEINGKEQKIKKIGIVSSGSAYSILDSFFLSWQHLFFLTRVTQKALWMLFTGKIAVKESLAGPIAIAGFAMDAARLGFLAIVSFMGFISMNLAIFNMLPMPILDGGHIFLLILEKVRSRKITQRTEEIINQIGITLLVSLAVFVSYNDLDRLGIFTKVVEWSKGVFNSIIR